MSVMVTLEIPVHKEKLEGFLDVLREALKETRVYEGVKRWRPSLRWRQVMSCWWSFGRRLSTSKPTLIGG